jgi:hypothetical protein
LVRKVRRAGALFERERARSRAERPWGSGSLLIARFEGPKDERGSGRGKSWSTRFAKGEPERPKKPRRADLAPTRRKTSGSKKEHGFPDGIKPLKRRYKA